MHGGARMPFRTLKDRVVEACELNPTIIKRRSDVPTLDLKDTFTYTDMAALGLCKADLKKLVANGLAVRLYHSLRKPGKNYPGTYTARFVLLV